MDGAAFHDCEMNQLHFLQALLTRGEDAAWLANADEMRLVTSCYARI